MWESETKHLLDEDEHTHVLYGLTTNERWGGVVAEKIQDDVFAYEGCHTLCLIARCTDPEAIIEAIEADPENHPEYLGFVAYPLRGGEVRAFGLGEAPEQGLTLNNVTDGKVPYGGPSV